MDKAGNIKELREMTGMNRREFCDYFILRVSWQGARSNNKETDIIYITARNEAS